MVIVVVDIVIVDGGDQNNFLRHEGGVYGTVHIDVHRGYFGFRGTQSYHKTFL